MGCRSAANSIKRMVATSPSGGVSSRSLMAAPRLSPLRRTPTCSPDTLASVSRWSSAGATAAVPKWTASHLLLHVSISTERTGAYRGARDPSRWRPRSAALPVRHRKGRFQRNVEQSVSCWSCCGDKTCPLCLGASSCLQGPVRSPRVPGGNTAEAQHGDCRARLHQEVHPSGSRHGNGVRSEAHRPCCCPR